MPAEHATGTKGILASSELNRDLAGVQGTYGWSVQSGAVTFSSGLIFNVAAIAAGDYTVNSVSGSLYAGSTVTLSAQDPTNPRVDIIVITSAGAVSAVAGTPAALTTTSGPVPPTPSSTQLEIARIFVPATGTALSSASITDRRHPVVTTPTAITLTGLTKKYKTATQVFTTNTTFADVIAAGSPATMSFSIAASEVWEAEYWIPLAFGGTGGAKFQLTGPAAPTGVDITGEWAHGEGAGSGTIGGPLVSKFTTVTAFSSDINAANSATNTAATGPTTYTSDGPGSFIHIRARIINGANAGTVTLQAAQSSSNSTTTLGIGSYMQAIRVA
jgi:hypothetical protein